MKFTKLTKGCIVFMKGSSGLVGYGNAQCISDVHHESLGTISLYGHNQHYKAYDIDRVVERPAAKAEQQRDDLLEACKACVRIMEHLLSLGGFGGLAVLEKAKQAIDKAEETT